MQVESLLTSIIQADADLIPLGRLQPYLGPLIAARRTPKIVKQYTDIGGGSPILKWSRQQAAATCAVLDRTNPETAPHKPYVAFRYADPLTEDTYAELLKDGFGEQGRALAFTQYPQYSCSTTGSSLNEIWKQRQRLEGRGLPREKGIQWSVIDRWPIHPLLVESFAQRIQATLDTYPPERRKDAIILFSAHSLPMSVVNRGDTYPSEVAATVSEVMRRLNHSNPYRLCWQSQVGPSAWLGAQTADTVVNYVKRGHKDLILVPIAFTSDHIETLFEIDQEVIHEADQAGAEGGVRRVESLNGSETFVDCLADVARKHMKGEGGWGGTVGGEMRCSRQMAIRCQGCTSERCLAQKRYFVGEGEGAPAVM